MKSKYILIVIVVLLIIVGVVVLINYINKRDVEIKNIERLYYSYTNGYAMNASVSYELSCKDKCTLSYKGYGIADEDAKKYEIDKSVLTEIEDLFNKYKIGGWGGFKKYDKNVLDGDSFNFILVFDGDKRIEANGYMSWPKHYGEVKKGLELIFEKAMK